MAASKCSYRELTLPTMALFPSTNSRWNAPTSLSYVPGRGTPSSAATPLGASARAASTAWGAYPVAS